MERIRDQRVVRKGALELIRRVYLTVEQRTGGVSSLARFPVMYPLSMSTARSTIDDVLGRLAPLNVRARAMFGEFVLYCDEKVVALICDDRVFLKETEALSGIDESFESGPPYPGAKDHRILHDRFLHDEKRLRVLVQGTADLLPLPKKRKAKKKPAKPRG
ncbi:MAG: TfoX/Sxy family transcriptional regulator of competence genes [Planctomycetota bacterium]|jgi:TfoX/Sxy family transcriptional regulator of competence genes